MKENKKHIGKEDFQRYLENQMTDAERNAFERELQKHPFETEALEGFQQISTADLDKDLKELSRKLSSNKQKSNTRFWAVAATFLLIISTGIIWYQLKEAYVITNIAETKIVQKEKDITPQSETQIQELNLQTKEDKSSTNEVTKAPTAQKAIKKQVVPAPEKTEKKQIKKPDTEENNPIDLAHVSIDEKTVVVQTEVTSAPKPEIRIRGVSSLNEKQKTETGSPSSQLAAGDTKFILGKVISLSDSLALPGVTIVEKGTLNGTVSDQNGNFILKLTNAKDSVLVASFIGMEKKEFYPARDSNQVIGLEPSALALDEVITIGYGVMRETQMSENSENAQPRSGLNSFKKYLDEHTILPNDYPEKKVIVKVSLNIDIHGKITSVENTNQSETSLFEKAKQILMNGPAWNPKTTNGNPVKSKVSLRIVFRKE